MSLYNALFETTTKLKKATGTVAEGAAKSTRDTARTMQVAAKSTRDTVKAAGPALGKIAKYAAYPTGLGVGIGLGGYVAGTGVGAGLGNVRDAVAPKEEGAAGIGRTLITVAILLLLVFGVVKAYRMIKSG